MEIHVLEKYGERMERRIAMLNRVIRKVTTEKVALCHDLKEVRKWAMWISGGKTIKQKRGSKCQGPRGEHVWHVRGTPGRASVVGTEWISTRLSQKKQETKLCNPLFSTEVAGFYGNFVQIGTDGSVPVHGLDDEVWIGLQSQLHALGTVHKWHSQSWWAGPCRLLCL